MAIDTYDKKRRALNFGFGLHNLVMPEYDAVMNPSDKVHLLNKYGDFNPLVVNGSIHYAIEIFLPGVNESDSTIGLVDDAEYGYSVFRFVIDRPQYDGVTVIPTWENLSVNDKVWYNGILLDGELGSPNRNIDLSGTGEYGTLSGMNFSVSNAMVASSTLPFWKVCESLGIEFFNRIVKFYVVIDDVFYNGWQGVVSSVPYDEASFKFVCKADFKTVHKSIPPETINDTNYPDAISESKGKAIPICLGRVPYASIYNVDGLPEEVALLADSIGGTEWNTAQSTGYTIDDDHARIVLKTPYKIHGDLSGSLF